MNMKRIFALALMALLLCWPMMVMAEDITKTERMTIDGITYEITYPTTITCGNNNAHNVTISFLWQRIEYTGEQNQYLWIPYKPNYSNNATCTHSTDIINFPINYTQNDCTQRFADKLPVMDRGSRLSEMDVVLLANSEHDYAWEQQSDKHHGKCQNGGCMAEALPHDISWSEWVSDGENRHTRECSVTRCTIKETEDHNFAGWMVTKPATTTEAGTEQRACTACGHLETREIPRLPALPQTGDDSNVILWSALVFASVIGMTMLVRKKKTA